jgi:hypothetical protein
MNSSDFETRRSSRLMSDQGSRTPRCARLGRGLRKDRRGCNASGPIVHGERACRRLAHHKDALNWVTGGERLGRGRLSTSAATYRGRYAQTHPFTGRICYSNLGILDGQDVTRNRDLLSSPCFKKVTTRRGGGADGCFGRTWGALRRRRAARSPLARARRDAPGRVREVAPSAPP